MKKVLLTTLALVLTLTVANAQHQKKSVNDRSQFRNVEAVSHAGKVKTETLSRRLQARTNDRMPAIQSMQKVANLTVNQSSMRVAKTPKAVEAHSLEGIYNATGYDYWEGTQRTWQVTVTQDPSNAKIFWFTNLIEDAFIEEVYGELNASSTKISIPADQTCVATGSYETNPDWGGYLVSITSNGGSFTNPVEANVSVGSGQFTFTTGFGVYVWDDVANVGKGYSDGIAQTPAAVFTDTEGGTGGTDPDPDAPASEYFPPTGTLFLGMSDDMYTLGANYAVAPPYSTWTFKNNTVVESQNQTSSWAYTDSYENNYSATTTDLAFDVTAESFTMPTLTTTIGASSTNFTLGAYNKNTASYIDAGGGSYATGTRTFNLTNANPDNEFTSWRFGDNNYIYGTGSAATTNNFIGLISYFDGNPDGMIYFEGVNIFCGVLTGAASTPLKMTVVRASKTSTGGLILSDTIAQSNTTIGEAYAVPDGEGMKVIRFSDFYAVDEFGLESPIDYLEIDGSFALILTGYTASGVSLSVMSEYLGVNTPYPGFEKKSFILSSDLDAEGKNKVYSWTNVKNTMLFSLAESYYTYITAAPDVVDAATAGGTYTVMLEPYFNKAEVTSQLPSWVDVSFDDHFGETEWYSNAILVVEALPGGVEGRSVNIEFGTWGARTNVLLNQGNVSGVNDIRTQLSRVVNTPTEIQVTYPADFNRIALYSATGQRIGEYALPASGQFKIPAQNLTKGVYVLRLDGTKSETVKIVR
ncbi:MAG: T9SS type A sorting domain-containing protein [Prevotellaceae bacterium]|jgi:hypothetical protein|nr:T9SS type A sorting domain-containing protein [Prevotellaceae bacterium]